MADLQSPGPGWTQANVYRADASGIAGRGTIDERLGAVLDRERDRNRDRAERDRTEPPSSRKRRVRRS